LAQAREPPLMMDGPKDAAFLTPVNRTAPNWSRWWKLPAVRYRTREINYALRAARRAYGRGGRMAIGATTVRVVSGVRSGARWAVDHADRRESRFQKLAEADVSIPRPRRGRTGDAAASRHADLAGVLNTTRRISRVLERARRAETRRLRSNANWISNPSASPTLGYVGEYRIDRSATAADLSIEDLKRITESSTGARRPTRSRGAR